MRITARQTLDGYGYRPVCMGLFFDDLRAQSLGQQKKDVWDLNVGHYEVTTLGKLLEQDRFNLLASRLIATEGFDPETRVYAASMPCIRAIKVGPREYRNRGHLIFMR